MTRDVGVTDHLNWVHSFLKPKMRTELADSLGRVSAHARTLGARAEVYGFLYRYIVGTGIVKLKQGGFT